MVLAGMLLADVASALTGSSWGVSVRPLPGANPSGLEAHARVG